MADSVYQGDIAKLDEEIRLLERRIFRLRSARNALVPIGHLPPELLEMIFSIARSQGTHIIHLSWVSRVWRTLALNHKTLWSLINNSNLRWTSFHLERSSPAPLVIHFPERSIPRKPFFKVMEQLHRIKSLILPNTGSWAVSLDWVILDAFSRNGSSPLPHLKTLRLGGDDHVMNEDMLSSLRNVVHLSLAGWTVRWATRPRLPFLRFLSIHSFKDLTLSIFFDCIESMPALEHLSFVYSSGSEDHEIERRSFSNGPHLNSLGIECPHLERDMVFFEKAGCLTRKTRVYVDGSLAHQSLAQVRDVLRSFNERAASIGHTQGVTHLGLRGDILIIEYGNVPLQLEDSPSSKYGYVHLFIDIPPNNIHHIFPTLSQSLSLKNLYSLCLTPPFMHSSSWELIVDIFGHISQLRHLVIWAEGTTSTDSCSGTETFINAITRKYSQRLDKEASPHLPFLGLQTLLFPCSSPSTIPLSSLLYSRKSLGLKLETLGLAKDKDVEALRGFMWEDMTGFVSNVVNAAELDLTKEEYSQFLERKKARQDLLLDISSLVVDN